MDLDGEDTQPGIPAPVARVLSRAPRRSPSQIEGEVYALCTEALCSVAKNTSDPAEIERQVRMWIGRAIDVARDELGEELAQLRDALRAANTDNERLRDLLRRRDPRREPD